MRINKNQLLLLFCVNILPLALAQIQPCIYEPTARCFDSTCGLELYDMDVFSPCICGPGNIGSRFSDCVSGSRTLSYFWKPPANCKGGIELPDPVYNIPCNLVCDAGTFLNTTSPMSCQQCSTGTASAGGGNIWTEWRHWPGQFSTNCILQPDPFSNSIYQCESWQLNGETIDSGDQHALNWLSSNLELRINLVRTGFVRFEYKISAEEFFDYLSFMVDGVEYLRISNTPWTNFTLSLPVGFHSLKWQYYKDRSITRGDDKVTIRYLTVVGTSYAASQCDPCPMGHFSNSNGSSICQPCPPGTHSNVIGASMCTPCPTGSNSLAGSTVCTAERNCSLSTNSTDLTFYYTPCINNFRTKKFIWVLPAECTPGTLPPDQIESCTPLPCLPGQYRSGPDSCTYCPAGQWSPGLEATTCSSCQIGQSTNQRQQHISNWTIWDPAFTTGCNGQTCLANGWRLGQWFTDSGIGHGDAASSWLTLTVPMNTNGSITFRYILPCNNESNFIFSINGTVVTTLPCEQNCAATEKNYTFQIPPNSPDDIVLQFQWTYEQRNTAAGFPCDRAIIKEVRLSNAGTYTNPRGGSTGCQDCVPGTFSDHSGLDACQKCAAGFSSIPKAASCGSCPDGSFADVIGSSTCIQCSSLTNSNQNHTKCVFNCTNIKLPSGRSYDLSQLKPWSISYVPTSNTTEHSFTANGSFCDWNPSCNSHAFVCLSADVLIQNRTNTNMGKVVSFEELSGNTKGIVLHFTSGDGGCSSHLQLLCDPAGTEVVSISQPLNVNTCNLSLSMSSKYGCPICSNQDFAYSDSECHLNSDGTRSITRTFYQINPYCYGGIPLPVPQQKQCVCNINNGGCDPLTTCIDYFGGHNCSACPRGYSGTGFTQCVPQCNPQCRNGGVCAFPDTCRCNNTGYTGGYCHIPQCDSYCQNGGSCIAPQICDCSGTGYNGTACEIPICDPPCKNGGVCTAANICDCSATGYYGVKCDDDAVIGGVSKATVAGIIIISLIILGFAVAFIVILYRKHQKLYSEYTRLQSSNIPMEESNISLEEE